MAKNSKSLTDEEREIIINALVETEAIEEDEREAFAGLNDGRLIQFAEATLNTEDDEDEEDDEDVVDNEESEDDDDDSDDTDDDDDFEDEEEEVTGNMGGKGCGKKGKKAKMKMEDDEEMTENQGPMTVDQWMAMAPPEVAEVITNAMSYANDEKAKLIEQLTVNIKGDQKKAMIKKLANNSLSELKDLLVLLPKPVVANSARRPVFAGASTPTSNSSSQREDSQPLVPPTIDWSEVSETFGSKRS